MSKQEAILQRIDFARGAISLLGLFVFLNIVSFCLWPRKTVQELGQLVRGEYSD